MSAMGLNSGYTINYNPLPSGVPSGTPSGKWLYLTVYPLYCPSTDTSSNFKSNELEFYSSSTSYFTKCIFYDRFSFSQRRHQEVCIQQYMP